MKYFTADANNNNFTRGNSKNKLQSGIFEVPLSVNHPEVDSNVIVGQITIKLDILDETWVSSSSLQGISNQKSRLLCHSELLPTLLSNDTLPTWVDEAHADSKSSIIHTSTLYDSMDINAMITILSACWSRVVVNVCSFNNMSIHEYCNSKHTEIPVYCLTTKLQLKRIANVIKFWNYDCVDDLSRVYSVVTSILSRIILSNDNCDHNVINLISTRLESNGSVSILWYYIQVLNA